MKAFITKNDDFKTVGFQVESNNGMKLFTWGIDHTSPFNFTKEVPTEPILETIFLLQKYDAKLNAYNRFVQDWFEIAKQNENVKVDGGVNFKEIEERIASINATIETLINKIK